MATIIKTPRLRLRTHVWAVSLMAGLLVLLLYTCQVTYTQGSKCFMPSRSSPNTVIHSQIAGLANRSNNRADIIDVYFQEQDHDAVGLFTYLRPCWRTLEEFLNLCGDLEATYLVANGSIPRLVEVLHPILTSFPKGPTFTEATEALNAYQALKQQTQQQKEQEQQQQQQEQKSEHDDSFTCIPWVTSSQGHSRASSLPRIAVMTTATKNNKDLSGKEYDPEARIVYEEAYNASVKEKMEYCERHGYDLHVSTDTVKGRNTGWYRFPAMLSHFSKYDWVFHVDLDTVILNHSIRLEQFLDPKHDLIIGVDDNGINNGAFFMRNSTWNRMLMAEAWTLTQRPTVGWYYYEQSAIMQLMKLNGVRNHMKLVPQQQFNSYLTETASPIGEYQPFLLHFAGRKDKWELVKRFNQEKQAKNSMIRFNS